MNILMYKLKIDHSYPSIILLTDREINIQGVQDKNEHHGYRKR